MFSEKIFYRKQSLGAPEPSTGDNQKKIATGHSVVIKAIKADNFVRRYHEVIIVMMLTSRPVLFPRYSINPQDRVQSAQKRSE